MSSMSITVKLSSRQTSCGAVRAVHSLVGNHKNQTTPENTPKAPEQQLRYVSTTTHGQTANSETDLQSVQKRSVQTHAALQPQSQNFPATSVTSWVANLVSASCLKDLSEVTIHRSKRMLLDTLGVGFLGFQTDIAQTVTKTCQNLERNSGNQHGGAVIWGSRNLNASPATAAYINGVSVHAMDFDDTWHPATHPSGPTLPAILALAESMTGQDQPSLEDVLVAYNVGIQVQGLLLRTATSAKSIPWRFHPPAIVGVMGSAAGCSSLLGLSPAKSRNALGIAASFAGAPMANAGTEAKPLHAGKAARLGLEAALLADQGLEGNQQILDLPSGFGAFYDDFDPETLLRDCYGSQEFLLHDQDIALKRFPAHLGMHWTIDAAMAVRDNIPTQPRALIADSIESIIIKAPKSKYIDRPLPATTHEARHSFQFNACTAILDGEVTPNSYIFSHRRRHELMSLLKKTTIETPEDNKASFQEMYVEIDVVMKDGTKVSGRCDTPYGHWRNPLSDADVIKKFSTNTLNMAHYNKQTVIELVKTMSSAEQPSVLTTLLHSE